jgi:hypothetical protein
VISRSAIAYNCSMRAFLAAYRGSFDAFHVFQPLKGDALGAEQDPQALVADVIDHPLGHQEIGQLGQAPGGKRQVMLGRLGLGDLFDLPPLP